MTAQTKARVRARIKARRQLLSEDQVKSASQLIVNRLVEFVDWSGVNTIHVYISIPKLKEVDTSGAFSYIQQNQPGTTTYAPIGKDETKHWVMAAKEKREVQPPPEIDIFIIPLVGFDERGYRIGNGGGYYDRLLTHYPSAQKIGLAFELQKVPTIPSEPHDVPMDVIITEQQIYRFAQ